MSRRLWRFGAVLGSVLICAPACSKSEPAAQDAPASAAPTPVAQVNDAEQPDAAGLKVGDKAPDFTLADQNGEQVALAELLKNDNVAVVFYRSADW